MNRALLHLKAMSRDLLWAPLGVALLFLTLALTSEGVRHPATLTIWSEMILPAVGAVLAAYGAALAGDPTDPLPRTFAFPAWRLVLERFLLLLGLVVLTDAVVSLLFFVALLPATGGPWPGLALVLAGMPPLLLFAALALLLTQLLGGSTAGAAGSLAFWLGAVMFRRPAYQMPWLLFHPFETYLYASSPYYLWNRVCVTAAGLLILGVALLTLRRVPRSASPGPG